MSALHSKRVDRAARRRTPATMLAILTALIAICVVAAAALASAALPLAPVDVGATAANHGLQVEPATITYTGDGTRFLGGRHVHGQNSSIHWTKWTSQRAVGTGYDQLDNCNPSCAAGKYHGYHVRIKMWRPRELGGTLVFTRMTIFYKHRPPGDPRRHYTFTDTHTGGNGGYSWGPPAEQGYCVHTHGLKPFAGCKNIHSLP